LAGKAGGPDRETGWEMDAFSSLIHERLRFLGARPEDPVLVGLSGGQDSTALLLALVDGWCPAGDIAAAHLDHAVREGSAQEAGKVEGFCRSLGIPILQGRLDPDQVHLLSRKKGSMEASMRELRYGFLRSCAASRGAKWVLTGHTLDDQVETILFRVLRGMNPMSFSGIPEKRPPFLRPLLGLTRRQTLSFCRERGIEPLVDPSNLDGRFARNRIRRDTIPSLKGSFHPDLEGLVLRLGSAAGQMGSLLEKIHREWFQELSDKQGGVLSGTGLKSLPPAFLEAVLAGFLREGIRQWPSKPLLNEVQRRIRNGREGGPVSLPGGGILVIREGKVSIRDRDTEVANDLPMDPVLLPLPGTLHFESSGITLSTGNIVLGGDFRFPAGDTVFVGKNRLKTPLWVRRRHPGDRFDPLGAGCRKKLKDFFIDRKIPRSCRDRIPLVLDNDGEILWVAGIEISQKAALKGYEGEEGVWIRIEGKDHLDPG